MVLDENTFEIYGCFDFFVTYDARSSDPRGSPDSRPRHKSVLLESKNVIFSRPIEINSFTCRASSAGEDNRSEIDARSPNTRLHVDPPFKVKR